MTRNVLLFVRDILQNMRDAEEFIQGFSYDEFACDKKTFNAVVRALEVMGEAAKHVPAVVRRKYPAVPWREMAGMRDKVIHFYFGVNREAVWLAVKERLPTIRPMVEEVLRNLERLEGGLP